MLSALRIVEARTLALVEAFNIYALFTLWVLKLLMIKKPKSSAVIKTVKISATSTRKKRSSPKEIVTGKVAMPKIHAVAESPCR